MNENKYFTRSELLDVERKHMVRRLKKISEEVDWGKVLDIGSAHSYIYRLFLNRKDVEYHGLDINKERVEYMNKTYPDIDTQLGDGEHLPYKNNSFDYIIIGELIEHIGNVENFLKECKRVLKRGGKLIGTTPNAVELKG